MNPYLKGIVGALGAAGTALATQYPGNHWSAGVIAVFTAVLVYLVPNTPKALPPQTGVSQNQPSDSTQPLPEVIP